MTIRLYLDEDTVRHALIHALRSRGIDVLTPLETGMIAQPDEAQLEYAARESRVLYSFNVGDFCRLHCRWLADGRSHTGIVLARQQQYSVGEQMRRLLRLIAAKSVTGMADQLDFLSHWG